MQLGKLVMRQDDYYQLLGVGRHVPRDALKRAFRGRVLALHPDHHPDSNLANEQTRRLIEAYRVLSDPATRRDYDRTLAPAIERAYAPIHSAGPTYPSRFARAFTTFGAAAAVICAALFLAQVILADDTSGYRAQRYSLHQPAVESVTTGSSIPNMTSGCQTRDCGDLVPRAPLPPP